jgi:hypothetical protein
LLVLVKTIVYLPEDLTIEIIEKKAHDLGELAAFFFKLIL